mgnify:FL=1
MKKILAAGLLLAPFTVAFAQSSVTLYGIVDAAIRRTNNEGVLGAANVSQTQMIGGGMSQSRWGINVTEDMGNGTKALVNLENRFLTDTGTQAVSQLFNQSWVGLQGGFGRVTVGRQYNVLFDLVTSTYASFPYSPYAEAFKPEIGFALGARNDNMVKYMAEFGPVRGAVQVSADEKAATGGKSAGGYLRYADGGIAAGLGYQNYKFGSGKKMDAFTVGASYRTGPFYFNGGYAENKADNGLTATDRAVLGSAWGGGSNGGFGGAAFLVANKRDMYTVGMGYQITPQINLGGHYYYARQSGQTAAADAKARFLVFVADYAFSKRTDMYVELDRTRLSGNVSLNGSNGAANGATSRTGYMVGLRHRF